MKKVSILSKLHKSTSRDYIERMGKDKVHCMEVAQNYGQEYWDGARCYGYGGYEYDGRWKEIAKEVIKEFGLTKESKVLDIGCGKAHLLYEIKNLLGCKVKGIDISKHALESAPEDIKEDLEFLDITEDFSLEEREYDLIISVMTLHNLELYNLERIFKEISKGTKNSYIVVESYRSQKELFNLQCWALTCQSFFSEKEWEYLFERNGLQCHYEFLHFE